MEEFELRQLVEQLARTRKSAILTIILPHESLLGKHLLQIHKLIGDQRG